MKKKLFFFLNVLAANFIFVSCNKEYSTNNNYGKLDNSDYYFSLTTSENDHFELTANNSSVQGLPYSALGKLAAKMTADSGRYCSVQILDTSKYPWFECAFKLPNLKANDSFTIDSNSILNGVSANFYLKNKQFVIDAFSIISSRKYTAQGFWPNLKFRVMKYGSLYPVYNSEKHKFENIQYIQCSFSGLLVKEINLAYRMVDVSGYFKIPLLQN